MKRRHLLLLALVAAAGGLLYPVGGAASAPPSPGPPVPTFDLSSFADAPVRPKVGDTGGGGRGTTARVAGVPLLFIHHSCGGQLLADPGKESSRANCIYDAHPNGGGLRRMLEASGYDVHEASYGSDVGDKTDMFDWLPKFQTKMDKILSVRRNDDLLPAGEKNQIVLFKSCFPNSDFVGVGAPPGDARGPELT